MREKERERRSEREVGRIRGEERGIGRKRGEGNGRETYIKCKREEGR